MTATEVYQRAFRDACGRFATGITAVTGVDPDGALAALTVNSFTSVSLDPMRVLFCIGERSSAYPILARADRVAVHVLADDQEEVARRLATAGLSGQERLADLEWTPGRSGEPLLAGAAARFAGPVVQRLASGDHGIFVVGVDDVALGDDRDSAMIFLSGRFHTFVR